mmetsp:Transcript_96236/g.167135  ORF Transcript_96236/g.167135 Transcript_96236/m.167135 type:complete len:348 (+) Transcript_96236:121-1164(+)
MNGVPPNPAYTPMNQQDEESEEESEEEQDHHYCLSCIRCFVKFKTYIFVALFVVLGAVMVHIMCKYEGWTTLTSVYVTTQIVTTIGYGDLTPNSPFTRKFIGFYVFFISVFIADMLTAVGDSMLKTHRVSARRKIVELRARRKSGIKKNVGFLRYKLPSLLASLALFAVFVAFGTLFYAIGESCSCSYGTTKAANYPTCTKPTCNAETGGTKNYVQAFYMSIITLTTVGFGDFTPLSKTGRILGIFWMFFGVITTGNLITAICNTTSAFQTKQKSAAQVSSDLLQKIVKNPNKRSLSKSEFVVYLMVKQGYMSMDNLDSYIAVFDAADKNNDGTITASEISAKFDHN